MAEAVLFELLHLEMVAQVYKEAESGDTEHGKSISTLEGMGFRAGQGLIERFTKETPSFKDELDIMKFICKEFWTNLFRKQIDNLRTNHQGTYVLQDNRFRLLTPVSNGKQYLEEAPKMHLRQAGSPSSTPASEGDGETGNLWPDVASRACIPWMKKVKAH
ncbi:trafficking protein particle complex subunit 6B-like isoform X3 [Stegostoma tigrinum]|uniref:trafficking protein particle complex subunit 6B-like isoform X3 n=1 Tax=Stegostoma tigrinum TaxID=3053191 RepID=UPI0028708B68|nr:trafficking protein particle complex subunit 6B-like isoform X3 [Stegostoma tigrinum]